MYECYFTWDRGKTMEQIFKLEEGAIDISGEEHDRQS